MEQVAHALGQMLLRALPTFVLVLLLYVFLRAVFFNPLARIMQRRYEESEGAMKAAREAMTEAERRSTQYQQALKEARAELYRALEHERQQWTAQNVEQVSRARAQAEERLRQAREKLGAEVEIGKARLESQAPELAEAVTRSILTSGAGTAR